MRIKVKFQSNILPSNMAFIFLFSVMSLELTCNSLNEELN